MGAPNFHEEMNRYLRSRKGHFGYAETPSIRAEMDGWIARRLRLLIWKQWQHSRRRFRELCRLGVPADQAAVAFRKQGGSWRMSMLPVMTHAYSGARLRELGLIALSGT
jgi:hypothetical protein